MCKLTFKEEFIKEIEVELSRPFKEGMSKEEFSGYLEGLKKALMVFKRLSGNKEVLAVDLLLDEPLRRVVEEGEL